KRRALTSNASPTVTVVRSLKRATPWTTWMPSAVRCSRESFGAMPVVTPCTCSRTLLKSTSTCRAPMPKGALSRMSAARRAAASRAFDATQPELRRPPPMADLSISTTGTARPAAAVATARPAGPAPMTQRSVFRSSAMRLLYRDARLLWRIGAAFRRAGGRIDGPCPLPYKPRKSRADPVFLGNSGDMSPLRHGATSGEQRSEADLSTEQAGAQAPPRLPLAHGHQRWP